MSKIVAKTGESNGVSIYNVIPEDMMSIRLLDIERQIDEQEGLYKRLYFAGPWFTHKAKMVYDTCVNISRKVNHRFNTIFFPALVDLSTPNEVYGNNIYMLNKCDEMIAFISEKDVGTALEIGYYLALNKPVTLLVYDETDLTSKTNLMLSKAAKCILIEKFEKFLLGTLVEEDYIKTNNDWKGVE